jgi:hypothetical protein
MMPGIATCADAVLAASLPLAAINWHSFFFMLFAALACGFAVAVPVSDLMCEFMEVEKGSLFARTDITKKLNAYIKANGLENPENRQQILPNEHLWKIMGDCQKEGVVITHFNIQKYINGHFLKPSAVVHEVQVVHEAQVVHDKL